MTPYLKDYVTEFNFLFHQIYKCARAQIECDENHGCYYNFERDAQLHGIFGDLWSSTRFRMRR
ncbi:hypothetical protein NSMM_490073 [Nitrosomonas mobilis]|uniref:Uncharacterized protein n=1 Tax=Nitrosomonas mobilis TaxID=51642 RepID=A0A1G5SG66_9PROT|nr:hypothetical protein NSMM_490073 [Nitrosomonas mobilis]